MSNSYSKTRILVECALMIAIGTVLSNIKIFTMPNGGSVTLSEDVTVEAPLVVETGKTVEIDLNGKDIINTTSLPDTDPRYGNTGSLVVMKSTF